MKTDVFSDFFIGGVKIFCGDDDTSPFLTKENADLADVLGDDELLQKIIEKDLKPEEILNLFN